MWAWVSSRSIALRSVTLVVWNSDTLVTSSASVVAAAVRAVASALALSAVLRRDAFLCCNYRRHGRFKPILEGEWVQSKSKPLPPPLPPSIPLLSR